LHRAGLGCRWHDSAPAAAASASGATIARLPLADLLAEQIQGPVLLVHGTADRSVPFDRSENMASAR
jgi:pimeloyl-ACP methyl ester carboxylesterase